ncbi:MAG: hypothetical protein JRJ73_09415 [Deltaproteobacteria bacterium]|nr:hypothetical protein [Deltaproteobacteria bacterium]
MEEAKKQAITAQNIREYLRIAKTRRIKTRPVGAVKNFVKLCRKHINCLGMQHINCPVEKESEEEAMKRTNYLIEAISK